MICDVFALVVASDDRDLTGAIVGGVVGGMFVFAVVLIIVILFVVWLVQNSPCETYAQ